MFKSFQFFNFKLRKKFNRTLKLDLNMQYLGIQLFHYLLIFPCNDEFINNSSLFSIYNRQFKNCHNISLDRSIDSLKIKCKKQNYSINLLI